MSAFKDCSSLSEIKYLGTNDEWNSITKEESWNKDSGAFVIEYHNHIFDKQISEEKYLATDASCTVKPTYYYSCECGAISTQTFEYGETIDHTFGEWVVENPATVNSNGEQKRSCSVCGLEQTEIISVLSHPEETKSENNSPVDSPVFSSLYIVIPVIIFIAAGVCIIKKEKSQIKDKVR